MAIEKPLEFMWKPDRFTVAAGRGWLPPCLQISEALFNEVWLRANSLSALVDEFRLVTVPRY